MQLYGRKQLQRQHEDYWGECWAEALGRQLEAQVTSVRPRQDPPDVEFHVRCGDGRKSTTWGEVTGVYYDSDEAEWLWGTAEEARKGKGYWQPDTVVAVHAVELVKRKRKKYVELVKRQGRGGT